MNEIQKLIRFDFRTVHPIAFPSFMLIIVLCLLFGLFFSPNMCDFLLAGALIYVLPLQFGSAENSLKKLYGILPVSKKSPARARFLYLFLVCAALELLAVVFRAVCDALKLYHLIPNEDSFWGSVMNAGASNIQFRFMLLIGLFLGVCLLLVYLEMMGQIFGREKIGVVMICTVMAAVFCIFLYKRFGLPFVMPHVPNTLAARIGIAVLLNLAMLGVSVLFGEITAAVTAKRER